MVECTECPLKAELEKMKVIIETMERDICDHVKKDIALDRQRITKLESTLPKLKQSLAQVAVSKVEGSWGVAGQRGDLIYSRLLTMNAGNGNGNGRVSYLSTGKIKDILGVNNYSQVKAAMKACEEKHLDVKCVDRGPRRTGLTIVEVKG